ncbi:SUPPRESSOR OF GAMMA RESPONSE 1 [Impatiens glandulifera]|uniref:SUPPRESSOR OF GAMMA RESPONSE 1 n=1 Tax=Impatiens glandulifera TaxID=253017 RepID=UPI001FB10A23|nr:SUPPRESSOR OF GAMMA RESPONSE 1 [Impatiens glandulifera]
MSRNWIVDGKGIASKVKNAGLPMAKQIKDCGANLECPNCHYLICNTTDVCHEWPGFPAGVKFDPSDTELLDHLAAKCRPENSTAHVFIDEFISTVEREEGICYSHPEDLPGVKKDGSSVHFFHRTINAYSTGQRKRRKVSNEDQASNSIVRWHKTGKTKPILENGIQKGCKKIMVLYGSCKKGFKPDKCNWVMHQYHLGTDEDEIEGQYVVSKIFYQQSKIPHQLVQTAVDPSTPVATAPSPPRPRKPDQTAPIPKEEIDENSSNTNTCLAGESQADDSIYDALMFDDNRILDHLALDKFGDLDNLQLETPPDFQLGDLQLFGSQDSIFGWLDNL